MSNDGSSSMPEEWKDRIRTECGPYRTVADVLFWMEDAARREELEAFRIKFEERHGPTDLTKRYTSTWPIEQQRLLATVDPLRYFNGLPRFVQGYLNQLISMTQEELGLDALSSELLAYVAQSRRGTSRGNAA